MSKLQNAQNMPRNANESLDYNAFGIVMQDNPVSNNTQTYTSNMQLQSVSQITHKRHNIYTINQKYT